MKAKFTKKRLDVTRKELDNMFVSRALIFIESNRLGYSSDRLIKDKIQWDIVAYRHVDCMTYPDIANKMGIKLSTARRQGKTGLRKVLYMKHRESENFNVQDYV